MKKITLLTMLVALFSGTAFAQQTTAFKCIDRTAQTAIRKAPKAVAENELVTPPASATVETWHTTDGVLYVNTASGPVEFRPDIKVAIDGSDIYLQGLAYWFPEGWVKGTISERLGEGYHQRNNRHLCQRTIRGRGRVRPRMDLWHQ